MNYFTVYTNEGKWHIEAPNTTTLKGLEKLIAKDCGKGKFYIEETNGKEN